MGCRVNQQRGLGPRSPIRWNSREVSEIFMEYTEHQKAAFKAAFSTRRYRQLAISVPLIGLMAGFALTQDRGDGTVFGLSLNVAGPVFAAVVVGAMIFSFRNWRCPACSKYLGRGLNPRHCQSCGVQLRG